MLERATGAMSALITADSDDSQGFFSWLFTSDGFHAPSITEFYPEALLWEGTIFEFNRITMVRIIAAVALVLIFWLVGSRAKLIPGRMQSALEMVLDFVRVGIVEDVLGKENAKKYAPFLTTLFLAIVFFNITGVIPFLNIAGTSLIGLPIIMAVWVFVMYLWSGIRKHGAGAYFKNSLFPPGIPWPIYLLLTPIEALQVFFLRPFTLALRLTANMMVGHMLLVLTFAATQFFFFEASGALKAAGTLSLVGGLLFTLFEIFVALLQAYVFVMLSTVYISLALEDEH